MSSKPPSPVRAAVSDAALDDFGGGGKVPLQERLQAAPTFLREKAVNLREDTRDRVHDIRVRDICMCDEEALGFRSRRLL